MTTCRIDDCDRSDVRPSCGLCRKHYQRQWKTGDPLGVRNAPEDPSVRFWRKVARTDSCWLWTAHKDPHGYGRFKVGTNRESSRVSLAHVFSWVERNGQVPAGLELDHLCRMPSCVRPDHLEPVTHAENIRRGKWGMNARAKKQAAASRRELAA